MMAQKTETKNTSQYVQRSLYILNTFLLGCHIFFLLFFKYVGAAFYDGEGTIDSLITEADQRLYKGKESTRNCVVYE